MTAAGTAAPARGLPDPRPAVADRAGRDPRHARRQPRRDRPGLRPARRPDASCSSSRAVAILGLAWVVGLSTERLGSLTGPQVGGILNATFGNIAELIIAFFALQAGLIDVVKASLTGSIIGNLLLVLGASVLVGGLRHGTQTFTPADRRARTPRCSSLAAHRPVRAGDLRVHDQRARRRARCTEESVLVVDRPDRRLRRSRSSTSSRNPSETLGGHGEPDGPRRAGLERPVAIVVLLGRGGAPGRPVGDPRRRDRAVHRAVRPDAVLRRASSSSRPSATSPSTSSRSSSPPRTRWSSRWRSPSARASRSPCSWRRCSCSSASSSASRWTSCSRRSRSPPSRRPSAISALIALDGESNWLEGALLMIVYADPRGLVLRVRLSPGRGGARAATARRGSAPPPRGGCGRQAATLGGSSSSVVGLLVVVVGRRRRRSRRRPGSARGAGASPSAPAWAASESAACCAS